MEDLGSFIVEAPEHSVYVLRGYAGTGKSTLVGAIAKSLKSLHCHFTLLAPTGRAAKVLEGYSGFPAHTIHRAIYRQKKVRDMEGVFDVGFNRAKVGTLYLIDEASMISNLSEGYTPFGSGRLLDDLMEYCMSIPGSKILFVGDDAQLPPVGVDQSPAMDVDYLRGYGCEVRSGSLTEIMRHESSGEIAQHSTLLRSYILDRPEYELDWDSPLLPFPSGVQVEIISSYDLPEYVERSYRRVGKEETLLITRSNREAEEMNRQIRIRTLGYDEDLVQGESLLVCRNNYLYIPKDEHGSATTAFIANGEIFRVERKLRSVSLHGFHFKEVELSDGTGAYFTANVMMDCLYSGVSSLTGEQRQALYESVLEDYSETTNRRMLFEQIRKDPFLNALQVKYAYALTCHKAQGGQWRDVYVSPGYLPPDRRDLSLLRWLYTAMTRATEKLYIIAPPAFLYGEYDSQV